MDIQLHNLNLVTHELVWLTAKPKHYA